MSAAPALIAHVVYRFAIGGLENGLVNLINRLPAKAWRHLVVSLTDIDPVFTGRVERDDVDYVSLHKASGHAFPLYPTMFRLFRQYRPAIVHTRNLAALEASAPAWAARIPARVHGEHGRDVEDPDGSSKRHQWVRRAFRPFVSRYVALSTDLNRYLQERVGVSAHRVEQICNGVDTERFRPTTGGRAPIDDCPFREAGLWLMGTVGRMETIKNQTSLARAFVRALELHPEARHRMRLVMIGNGRLKAQVEAILDEANARQLAWLPGERSDIARIMQGLDCFVLPSLAEGVSNTILEAMATGLPVVATRVGANPELLESELTGRLVEASDEGAMATEIVRYFHDPSTARRHGWAGRERVERHFSVERMVERYHLLYTDLIRAQGADAPNPRASASQRPTNS